MLVGLLFHIIFGEMILSTTHVSCERLVAIPGLNEAAISATSNPLGHVIRHCGHTVARHAGNGSGWQSIPRV